MENRNGKYFDDLSFARVLIVDDMPSNLVVAAGMLKKYKIQTDCVSGGQEAFDLIKKGEPVYHAVFMDQVMPGMDGMETVARIRSLDTVYAKTIPIIAMTGDETPGSEDMFLKNGFEAFIAKPLSFAKLDPVLGKWIVRKS